MHHFTVMENESGVMLVCVFAYVIFHLFEAFNILFIDSIHYKF